MEKDDTSSKLGAILGFLSNNQDDKQLKARINEKLSKEKQEEERNNRYRQKERLYQATPIVIDGLTMDGQKSIVKAIKSAVNFEVDTKKPEVKFPWLKIILGLLAFAAGLIIGFIIGAIKSIKDWGNLAKRLFLSLKTSLVEAFERLRSSKLGKYIEDLVEKIKGKFRGLGRRIRNSKLGKFVEEMVENLKSKFFELVEKVKNSKVGKLAEDVFNTIKTKFDDIVEGVKNFKPGELIKSKFTKITETIDEFFGPLKSLLPKAEGVKPLKILQPIFDFFGDIFKFVSGPFKAGAGLGKLLGRALGPIFALVEVFIGLYQSFTDPKLKDKSFLQKAVTGVVKGIIEFFTGITKLVGLDLFDFDEIRDRIDKVFESFKEGFIPGILQLLNQWNSALLSIPMKIIGWMIGWFDKDAGDKIKEYAKNFDISKTISELWNSIKELVVFAFDWLKENFTWDNVKKTFIQAKDWYIDKLSSLGNVIKDLLSQLVDWIKSLFTLDNIKNLILNATPLGLAYQGGKAISNYFSKDKETKTADTKQPIPTGDFLDDNERVMYSKRGSYSFDKNDQIVAMKKGGPIENALKNMDQKTAKSVDQLKEALGKLSQRLESHFNKTEKLYEAEYKIMNTNNQLLAEIKDKQEPASNVVVNNSSSNMVFSQKTASNLDYRSDMMNRLFAY